MSAAEIANERDEGERIAPRQAEHDRPCAEHTDDEQQGRADPALDGSHRQHHGHRRRPDAGGGPKPPIGDVADAQAFARDGRDQGDRPTEQHGEQIE